MPNKKIKKGSISGVGAARMSGMAYDNKMAYNKDLTSSARLHYLENEEHDKHHGSQMSKHMGGRMHGKSSDAGKKYGEPAKKYGEPAKMMGKHAAKMKFDSSTDKGIETLYTGKRKGE